MPTTKPPILEVLHIIRKNSKFGGFAVGAKTQIKGFADVLQAVIDNYDSIVLNIFIRFVYKSITLPAHILLIYFQCDQTV